MRAIFSLGLLLAVGAGIPLALSSPARAEGTTTIVVGDNWFCTPSFRFGVCETTVDAGSAVVWDYASGFTVHTSSECGSSLATCDPPARVWDSGTFGSGGKFSFTFNTPGTFLYRCQFHPAEMFGRIVVLAPTATPTPSPTPTPEQEAALAVSTAPATPTPGAGVAGSLPSAGGAPEDSSPPVAGWLAIAGGLLLLATPLALRLTGRRR